MERAGEIGLDRREPRDHPGELAQLDVLDTQLAAEPLDLRLPRLGEQLAAGPSRKEKILLGLRMSAQLVVEASRRVPRPRTLSSRERLEKAPEELVEVPVGLFDQPLSRGRACHGSDATFFTPIGRPKTGSSTAVSGSPASNP